MRQFLKLMNNMIRRRIYSMGREGRGKGGSYDADSVPILIIKAY